jgi:poly-gamma-glutamate synthesis protein (capsule biosynthesis protein)
LAGLCLLLGTGFLVGDRAGSSLSGDGGGGDPPTDVATGPSGAGSGGEGVPPAEPPTTTTTTAPPPRTFTLAAAGDVLLHTATWQQAQADAAATGKPGHDFEPMLAGVKATVSAADLAVCHLETPVAPPGGPYASYPVFSVPPEIVPALQATGFDACTTGSNHTFDKGADGVDRTLDALDAAGLAHAGSARTPEEAARTTLVDANGVTVGLLSYTYGTNGIPAPNGETWRANVVDEGRILADARLARERGAEVVVVSLHWGNEYVHEPNAQQLDLAPRLIRSPDIDLLLGHHAHVVQPVERVDGEWVVYGMGNMIANQRQPERSEGLLTRFRFTEQGGVGGTWAVTEAAYEPLVTVFAPAIRLLVPDHVLAGGDPAHQARATEARDRTTSIVGSRGAFEAGLVPLP